MANQIISQDFSQGLNTASDRSDLKPGELQKAVGIRYKRNDRRAWKIPGRTVCGTVLASNAVKGLKLCQFDEGGTDRLVALSSSALYAAPSPGATGVFAADAAGRSAQAAQLHGVHMDNKWFLSTGNDSNTVLDADGNYRTMGMAAPQSACVAAASALAGSANAPTATTNSGFTNPANAYDVDDDTFSQAFLTAAGTSYCTWHTWGSNTDADRRLEVVWRLSGSQIDSGGDDDIGDGGPVSGGFVVQVTFEVSEDGGSTWTTFLDQTFGAAGFKQVISTTVSANSNLVQFKATLTYLSGTGPTSLRIYETRILDGVGGITSPFSTVTGFYYAIAEFSDVYGIQSPPSAQSALIQLASGSSHDSVTITLPSAPVNSFATHWIIYRTSDGGTVPKQLGDLSYRIPIAETTAIDDFRRWGATEQPLPIVPLKNIRRGSSELVVPRDHKPPQFDHIGKFKGQIVGVKGRILSFSEPGFPESVPEINVISDFEMEERDQLVGTMQIGDTLWVGMTNAVLFLDDLPQVVDGQLIQPPKRVLSGFPGCPATYGFTTYEEQGTPRGAWVTRHGIYGTDGFRGILLTRELDWENAVNTDYLSSAVLHYNQRTATLTFAYASGASGNDRYYNIHMDETHRKSTGLPKITGPHYGKINCMTSGETGGVYRVWSGHVTDGKVYLENSGVKDESLAYDGSSNSHPIDVQPGRLYGPQREMYVVTSASLRHTGATGKSLAVAVITGRDDRTGIEQTVNKTVSLNGQRGTEFFVGRAGEYSEFEITGQVNADFALQELNIKARMMGQAGTVLR